MRSAAQKARAENHVRFSLNQWLDHQRVFRRIVFPVGGLNDDEVARGFLNAAAQGGSFAHILRLKSETNMRMLRLQFRENLSRAITGSVVDADQLDFERNGENLQDHLAEGGAFVIDRHHDGKLHGAPSVGEAPSNSLRL